MAEAEPKVRMVSVIKLIHLDFGLRAGIGKDGHLIVHLMNLPGSYSFPGIEWKDYRRFFARSGVDIIGVEELSEENQIPTSHWSFYDPHARNIESSISYLRSGLVNAARKAGSELDFVLAKNIDFSLRAMEYRLRDVSISYGDQLSHSVAAKVKPGGEFADTDTLNLFLNVHSFLAEAGTLRDHLAALLACRVYLQPKVRKMSVLREYIGKCTARQAIGEEILQICDRTSQAGWLARMSKMRNHIIHVAPVSAFSEFAGMTMSRVDVSGIELPALTFEVPFDLILAPKGPRADLLKVCVQMARNMLLLTRHVVLASGITPEPLHFTDADFAEQNDETNV
jgi:hypothetical protein